MRSDILKLRMIKDLTYHMTTREDLLTSYDFDMFWDIVDKMSAIRQNELWDQRQQIKNEQTEKESADT